MTAAKGMKQLFLLGLLLVSQSALPFGPVDVFGMVFDVGSKVGGALIDKAIDATKDPEVERQKKLKAQEEQDRAQIVAFKKAEDEIESHREWTPLLREKARLKLISVYAQVKSVGNFVQTMQDRQEAARRAENDRLLSVGGLASTVASSAMNSTSVQLAHADALVKAGVPQAQSREALSYIDNRGQQTTAGKLHDVSTAAVGAQIVGSTALGGGVGAAGQTPKLPQDIVGSATDAKESAAISANDLASQPSVAPAVSDFFSPDLGRKMHVEFVGSERISRHLHEVLAQRGHLLVNSQAEADVYYRIEGEFEIPENSMHQGVKESAGKILEHVATVPTPEVKVKGSIASFFVKSLMAITPAKDPSGVKPEVKLMMAQSALIVASRNAANAQELRVSVFKKENSNELRTDGVMASALDELFTKLGVPTPPNADTTSDAVTK